MNRPTAVQNGFSLIEIIVALTVLAVLGVLVFRYLGTPLTGGTDLFSLFDDSLTLERIGENITADYRHNFSTGSLAGLKTKIGEEGTAKTNDYGSYAVVENRYITFINNVEDNAPLNQQNTLKVTIKNDRNKTLTMVFVQF
ncbi:MAG: prepilin-type N-terminal cleavage/methylation domain-containing protein [Deltaproteobacteria bacterium]|nr:prepilin-type N-terminal cleavage/methylation domain-containing protein [Syntrophaceae bacterium]NLX52147.1 prepilin-type N-terminal cleavage/methylation domain-containing protein [Deltaproteobacteria bacterium]